jgi:hypothetical protein
MVLRQAVEEMQQRRNLIVAAVHANSNWDGSENMEARTEYLKGIEKSFAQAVEHLHHPERRKAQEKRLEKLMDTPFWDAARRGMQRQMDAIHGINADDTVDDAVAKQRANQKHKGSYDQI